MDIEKEIAKLRAQNFQWSKEFGICMTFQNKGIEFERLGMKEEAAFQYEKAVENGRKSKFLRINNYYFSIERLTILYRKLKRYDKEIQIIRFALTQSISESDKQKLLVRLDKASKLQKI